MQPDGILINPAYVRTMAAYNAEMNRRVYGAAERLSDDVRRKDCGAFWGSIHGTLNHILWGDQMWMARFDNWPKPAIAQKQSPTLFADFAALQKERVAADVKISDWAARMSEDWLSADQVWFSGSTQREMRMARGLLVTHFFNHQTHHRGQAHALITAAGEQTGDTDLFLVI
ncbi:MAG: DinB family protein [Pseudomonadota bacterium]